MSNRPFRSDRRSRRSEAAAAGSHAALRHHQHPAARRPGFDAGINAAAPNHYRLGPLLGSQPSSATATAARRDGWLYNLFAMVHGRSAKEFEDYRADSRAAGQGVPGDEMLVSSRILKKTGLRV